MQHIAAVYTVMCLGHCKMILVSVSDWIFIVGSRVSCFCSVKIKSQVVVAWCSLKNSLLLCGYCCANMYSLMQQLTPVCSFCSWGVLSGQSPYTTWRLSRGFCLPCQGTLPDLGRPNVSRACSAWWLRYSLTFYTLYALSIATDIFWHCPVAVVSFLRWL